MALQLEQSAKGVVANYWKITKVTMDAATDQTRVSLGLYKDAETREASLNNVLDNRQFQYIGHKATLAELYARIKEPTLDDAGVNVNPFTDALDV